jgi:hypothetical protein
MTMHQNQRRTARAAALIAILQLLHFAACTGGRRHLTQGIQFSTLHALSSKRLLMQGDQDIHYML